MDSGFCSRFAKVLLSSIFGTSDTEFRANNNVKLACLVLNHEVDNDPTSLYGIAFPANTDMETTSK